MTTVYDEYPLLTFKTEQEVGCFMRFEQLNEGVWAMTYLIVDEETQQAALVDPVYDFLETYLSIIEEQGLNLVYAIATHTHADHITACFTLREQLGCDYVMSHEPRVFGMLMMENIMLGSFRFSFTPLPPYQRLYDDHVPAHDDRRLPVQRRRWRWSRRPQAAAVHWDALPARQI